MGIAARCAWLPLLLSCASAAAQPAGPPLALVTTYADGRVTESFVAPTGFRTWTPLFPRVPGWRDPQGVLPVKALNLVAKAEGDVLKVSVSVLRGAVHEVVEPVTDAVVGVGDRVEVHELRRVGVMPITLSATLFAAPALHVPRTASSVAELEVENIEPVLEPKPGYLVTVRNRSDVPLVTVAFNTYVGGRAAASGQQGDPSAIPVAEPGGTFTFRVPIASALTTGRAFATGEPLDDVVLSGAIWANGRFGGDPARVRPLLAVHRGRLAVLDRVIGILRDAGRGRDSLATLDNVRAAIAAVPIAADAVAVAAVIRLLPGLGLRAKDEVEGAVSVGSLNGRARLLEDIDRVRPQITPAEARQWIDEALPACEAWRARLQALFPAP